MSPPLNLAAVDKLEFLILVDNLVRTRPYDSPRIKDHLLRAPECGNRFSTLPPGFTHELPQHMLAKDVPKDALTGLPTVDLDNYCCGAHGLAVLIKTTIGDESNTVLFDSGPEPKSIERNIKAMKVDLTDLDAIALSHWHRDHSGGILRALEIRQNQLGELSNGNYVQVDLHPNRPIRRGISRPPDYIPICTLPTDPTFEEIEQRGGKVELNDKPHEILNKKGIRTGIGISGEINRVTSFEVGLPGALTWMKDEIGEEGWFNDHLIMDERYAVVDVKGHGLVVFSSCSHAGICNVIHSLQPFNRPIHAIVGGLHLSPVEKQPVTQTVDFLSRRIKPPPNHILPLHCTGLEPRAMLREKMGNKVVSCGTGLKVIWKGSDKDEEKMDEGFEIVQ